MEVTRPFGMIRWSQRKWGESEKQLMVRGRGQRTKEQSDSHEAGTDTDVK